MSRAARTIVRRNVERCEQAALGLQSQDTPTDPAEQLTAARELLRAYRAWEHAATSAAPFYREHSAARAFAESTALLLRHNVKAMQAGLALLTGGGE